MILDIDQERVKLARAPRTSGDDPVDMLLAIAVNRCSPHERG